MPAWEAPDDNVSALAIMDGTQSTLSSGKYALWMDLKWGGARQRGGRRREGGEMDGAQPRVEPSAADSPPRLFGNSKVSPECTGLQHRSPLDVWAGRCLLCAKPGGRIVKIRKGNPTLGVIICENDECLHMWRGRKKNRSGRQRQTHTVNPHSLGWKWTTYIICCYFDNVQNNSICTVWHWSREMKAVLCEIKLKPHAARTRYSVRAPTGPRRPIHDSARLSQSVTSSRQAGAISGGWGGGGGSGEPSTNHRDEVSYR